MIRYMRFLFVAAVIVEFIAVSLWLSGAETKPMNFALMVLSMIMLQGGLIVNAGLSFSDGKLVTAGVEVSSRPTGLNAG